MFLPAIQIFDVLSDGFTLSGLVAVLVGTTREWVSKLMQLFVRNSLSKLFQELPVFKRIFAGKRTMSAAQKGLSSSPICVQRHGHIKNGQPVGYSCLFISTQNVRAVLHAEVTCQCRLWLFLTKRSH
jgi:hypothetical protein